MAPKKAAKKVAKKLTIDELGVLVVENRPCDTCHPVTTQCSTCLYDAHLSNNYFDKSGKHAGETTIQTPRPIV